MTSQKSASEIVAPEGMTGIAVEPWSAGEVYAVAANWAQASCPVRVYGEDGWGYDEHGRQVADFRHRKYDALAKILTEAIEMGGDEADEDEIAAIVGKAIEITDSDESE